MAGNYCGVLIFIIFVGCHENSITVEALIFVGGNFHAHTWELLRREACPKHREAPPTQLVLFVRVSLQKWLGD